jgi:hypothetical protein
MQLEIFSLFLFYDMFRSHHKHNETQKKNQEVQKTYYITGRVEDTQEEQLGKFK